MGAVHEGQPHIDISLPLSEEKKENKFKKLSELVNFCIAILILKMEENRQHVWHIMLYYFKKSKNVTKTKKKICAMYGEGAVTDRTCQKGFVKFCAGDFSLDDAPRLGR